MKRVRVNKRATEFVSMRLNNFLDRGCDFIGAFLHAGSSRSLRCHDLQAWSRKVCDQNKLKFERDQEVVKGL